MKDSYMNGIQRLYSVVDGFARRDPATRKALDQNPSKFRLQKADQSLNPGAITALTQLIEDKQKAKRDRARAMNLVVELLADAAKAMDVVVAEELGEKAKDGAQWKVENLL